MTPRPLPLRHLLCTKDSEVAPSQGHPNETRHSIPSRTQDPSWKDLLGER